MTTTAHVYIVENDAAWRRLNDLAAAEWEPGSPGEMLYLNALIGDAATMHLASADEQNSRLRSLTAHIEATGDARGLHGSLLSLTNAAARRGDAAAFAAAAAISQVAARQVPRAVAGAVPVYDTKTRALVLADPAAIARALPPLPTSLSDTSGIVNFLDGIDRRIHDAFGNPQSSIAGFDPGVASIVSGLNEAAVTIAQMGVIGMLIPGGQAIGAILLVGAGVLAVGAAAVSLFGSLVDLFTSTEPARIDLRDAVVPPNPYEPGDKAQPTAAPDPSNPNSPDQPTEVEPPVNDPQVDPGSQTVSNNIPATRENDPPVDPPSGTAAETVSSDIPGTRESDIPVDQPSDAPQGGGGQPGGGDSPGGGHEDGGGQLTHEPPRVDDAEGDQDAGRR